jgi:hypothetical protein
MAPGLQEVIPRGNKKGQMEIKASLLHVARRAYIDTS